MSSEPAARLRCRRGEVNAAAVDADDRERSSRRRRVALDDLVRDTRQRSRDVARSRTTVSGTSALCTSFLASRDRVKGTAAM
jgi:hypothetical protein